MVFLTAKPVLRLERLLHKHELRTRLWESEFCSTTGPLSSRQAVKDLYEWPTEPWRWDSPPIVSACLLMIPPSPCSSPDASVSGLRACASRYWETAVTRYLPHSLPYHLKDSPKTQLSQRRLPQWHHFKLKFVFNFIVLCGVYHSFTCSAFYSSCLFSAMPNLSSQRTRIFMMPVLR